MPEGHTIHRLARDHRRRLTGGPLAVSSPQGRAAAAASALDGGTLVDVDAHGKHLLYRWRDPAGVPLTLHVHLGLFGRFRGRRLPPPDPKGQVRLRIVGPRAAFDLSGPTACELIDPVTEAALRSRLGPDPLRDDADPEAFVAALGRRRIPIAQALLDQRVIAVVGNVYRAEALFAEGIDPHLPARELPREAALALWRRIAEQLADGVREGRIITARDALSGPSPGRAPRRAATYVYRQTHCLRCGGDVAHEHLAGRTLWWCPAEQPTATRSARTLTPATLGS